ncbi:MAG: helix-turn-helix transcriptional regulator [Cloacibacillus sp.]
MAFRADLLLKWRKEHSLTQGRAGQMVGVCQTFWRSMETGAKQPSIDTLLLITKVTGIPLDELLENPTPPPPRREREEASQTAAANRPETKSAA